MPTATDVALMTPYGPNLVVAGAARGVVAASRLGARAFKAANEAKLMERIAVAERRIMQQLRELHADERGSLGRGGRQQRLRELANDPNVSKADRGWIRQELNQIERGRRINIRNPPGKDLAHSRGREAAKGFDHVQSPSNLQDRVLHRTQHKFDNFGKKNKLRR